MGVAAVSATQPLVAGLGLRATARANHLQALWQQACDWLVQQPDWPVGQAPAVTTLAVDTVVMHGYAASASALRRWMRSAQAVRWQNRIFGGLLMLVGLGLFFVQRSGHSG